MHSDSLETDWLPQVECVVNTIVEQPHLHAKWLNTLSLMENTGARKIAAFEDGTGVTESILKHAAEEFRHAYFLKRQIHKIVDSGFDDYQSEWLLLPAASRNYLRRLDVSVSRYAKNTLCKQGRELKAAAYLLTTYAIEVRADMLYPVYQEKLKSVDSPVSVRSIIVEEEGHLEEMISSMEREIPDWQTHAEQCTLVEQHLFECWISRVAKVVGAASASSC